MKQKKLTKAVLYQDITQQGFILPKLSSTICNLAYLLRVKNGAEYCPHEHEVNGILCLNPPKKLLLLMYVQEELEKNGDARTVSFDEKHLPDVDWCLKALSSLDPLHQIFEPDYVPPSSHRGRRGIRYIPTAEDLLFMDQEKQPLGDREDRNQSNQPAQESATQFSSSHKFEFKASNLGNLSDQPAKNGKKHLDKNFQERQVPCQSFKRQNDSSKGFNQHSNQKDLLEDRQIGPLVQMLKALDDRGLLEECMQHYIEIQSSFDQGNHEQTHSKVSDEISKNQSKVKDRQKGSNYIRERGSQQKEIQYFFKKNQNQPPQIQSPTNNKIYGDERSQLKSSSLTKLSAKSQQFGGLESHKTSASSVMKNQKPHQAQMAQEVKAFGTPESRQENGDEEKIYQKDELMAEENPTALFEEIREKPNDGVEENQISVIEQTPQAVFII